MRDEDHHRRIVLAYDFGGEGASVPYLAGVRQETINMRRLEAVVEMSPNAERNHREAFSALGQIMLLFAILLHCPHAWRNIQVRPAPSVRFRDGTAIRTLSGTTRKSAERLFPVCTPALARLLKEPGDLAKVNCIPDVVWKDRTIWCAGAGSVAPPHFGPAFSLYAIAVQEALLGHAVLYVQGSCGNHDISPQGPPRPVRLFIFKSQVEGRSGLDIVGTEIQMQSISLPHQLKLRNANQYH
jgi:hypothetical protein